MGEREPWAWTDGEMSLGQACYELHDELYFCGCGMPEAVAQLVADVLDAFGEDGHCDYEKATELLRDDGVRYFVYYQLDRAGFAEHGSSVPGWLTPRGSALRTALRRFGAKAAAAAQLDYATGEVI